MSHQYQGGAIIPSSTFLHYHVDYYHGRGREGYYDEDGYGWGYTIEVIEDDKFSVVDEGEATVLFRATTLIDAVKFCFDKYQEKYPGETLTPIWGAGAPNEALKELGYQSPFAA